MGLDVYAISRAERIPCNGDEDVCDDTHTSIDDLRKGVDRLRAGCYIVGHGGREFDFRAGSYGGYDLWLRALTLMALGVEPDEVWEHPRRFRGKPFVELIELPAASGPMLGPGASAKLHGDFVAFARKARRSFHSPSGPLARTLAIPGPVEQDDQPHDNRAGVTATRALADAIGGTVTIPGDLSDLAWMWDVYRNFRRACKVASDRGFLLFC